MESNLGIGSRINHPALGKGVIIGSNDATYTVCYIMHGVKHIGRHYDQWDIIEAIPASDKFNLSEAEKALKRILLSMSDISEVIELGDKWDGGVLILKPGDDNLKEKKIPIDTFFHKIVMVRDRLRVMEQRINAHKDLSDEDKVNLQQYLTRIYGSLTTFNVLFKQKDDHFKGEKTT